MYAPITDLTSLAATATHVTGDHLRAIAADSAPPRTASWLERIGRPVLTIHGERDTTVPVNQTALLREALRRHGISHTCLTLPDEAHMLRRADSISRALEAELSFYADVLGHRTEADVPNHRHVGTGWPQR